MDPRLWVTGAVALATAGAPFVAIPVVRHAIGARAAAMGLEVSIREVRPVLGVIHLRDVTVRAVVKDDEVRLEEARLEAFGGKVSAAGTHLAVARPEAPFEVAPALDHVGAEDLLKMLGNQKVLTGTIDAKVGITGKGWKACIRWSSEQKTQRSGQW